MFRNLITSYILGFPFWGYHNGTQPCVRDVGLLPSHTLVFEGYYCPFLHVFKGYHHATHPCIQVCQRPFLHVLQSPPLYSAMCLRVTQPCVTRGLPVQHQALGVIFSLSLCLSTKCRLLDKHCYRTP